MGTDFSYILLILLVVVVSAVIVVVVVSNMIIFSILKYKSAYIIKTESLVTLVDLAIRK